MNSLPSYTNIVSFAPQVSRLEDSTHIHIDWYRVTQKPEKALLPSPQFYLPSAVATISYWHKTNHNPSLQETFKKSDQLHQNSRFITRLNYKLEHFMARRWTSRHPASCTWSCGSWWTCRRRRWGRRRGRCRQCRPLPSSRHLPPCNGQAQRNWSPHTFSQPEVKVVFKSSSCMKRWIVKPLEIPTLRGRPPAPLRKAQQQSSKYRPIIF